MENFKEWLETEEMFLEAVGDLETTILSRTIINRIKERISSENRRLVTFWQGDLETIKRVVKKYENHPNVNSTFGKVSFPLGLPEIIGASRDIEKELSLPKNIVISVQPQSMDTARAKDPSQPLSAGAYIADGDFFYINIAFGQGGYQEQKLEAIKNELKPIIQHELKHFGQVQAGLAYKRGPRIPIFWKVLDYITELIGSQVPELAMAGVIGKKSVQRRYFALPDEIEAFASAMRREAKMQKRKFSDVLTDYIKKNLKDKQDIDPAMIKRFETHIKEFVKKQFPTLDVSPL